MSESRLEQLKQREAKIKAQIKQEKAKMKALERRARNHRLIEVGAVLESDVGVNFTNKEDRQILHEVLTEKHTSSSGYTYTIAEMILSNIKKKTHIHSYD